MAACRSCEAPIAWATTSTGKHMPLDEAPSEKGTFTFIKGQALTATDEDRRLKRPLYTSHFATCPDAAKFRGRR